MYMKFLKFITVFIMLLGGSVFAVDEFDAPAETEKPEEKPVVQKDPSQMNLNELQEYQKFVYVPGGRDPFTFRLPERKPENIIEREGEKEDDTIAKQSGMPSEKQQELKMEQWFTLCRNYLIASAYKDAIDVGESAKENIEKWGGISSLKAQKLYERITSLKQTAIRLLNKEEITNKFAQLPIIINGIRIAESGSAALVNDNIVEIGMTLKLENGEQLQIDSIKKNGVVFIYNGLKLMKEIGEETTEEK